MQLQTIGIDLGKTLFHLVGLNQRGEVVVRKKFSRRQLLHFTANLQVELIGMEACGGSHFLGRALREQGHEVRLKKSGRKCACACLIRTWRSKATKSGAASSFGASRFNFLGQNFSKLLKGFLECGGVKADDFLLSHSNTNCTSWYGVRIHHIIPPLWTTRRSETSWPRLAGKVFIVARNQHIVPKHGFINIDLSCSLIENVTYEISSVW